ncbi:MAG: hypothetical protein ACRCYU_05455, partial [Nocardioides sp.]
MTQRFREIEDYSGGVVTTDSADASQENQSDSATVDVVFARAAARPGLVADMLSGVAGSRIAGGSMSVLGGHTLSCWLVPAGVGEKLELEISELATLGGRVRSTRTPGGSNWRPGVPRQTIWLAWQAPDSIGIFAAVLDKTFSYLRRSLGSSTAIDVRYAVSRVLMGSRGCAGKVKLHVGIEPGALKPLLEGLQVELRHVLTEGDGAYNGVSPWWVTYQSRVRRSALWRRRTDAGSIVVQEDEPGEEPWASLLPT